jgi:hypothetical protein
VKSVEDSDWQPHDFDEDVRMQLLDEAETRGDDYDDDDDGEDCGDESSGEFDWDGCEFNRKSSARSSGRRPEWIDAHPCVG